MTNIQYPDLLGFWERFKRSFWILLFIILGLSFMQLDYFYTWAFIVGVVAMDMIFHDDFKFKKLFKSALWTGIIITMSWAFSPLGWWGYCLTIMAIVCYILYTRWEQYIFAMKMIEKMIWGKSLDQFKKGDKKPKVKFVIKK